MSAFRFKVEKTLNIPGRGVVVAGKVEEGQVAVEQVVGFLQTNGEWKDAVVLAIEVEQRLVEEAQAGQQASLLLEGVKRKQIPIGTILLEPPQGPVSRRADRPEPVPEPTFRTRSSPAPGIPTPPQVPAGRPIQPSSGSWRLAILLLAGLLFILLFLFYQGKLDPMKRRVEVHSDRIETVARSTPLQLNGSMPGQQEGRSG